jgi:uncharacterized membrane protein YeaQ/YmgE (transglycosylase-associated protein family)
MAARLLSAEFGRKGRRRCQRESETVDAQLEDEIMLMNILGWLVFGLIAGGLAQFIMPGRDVGERWDAKGFLITAAIGIVGAMLGGFLSSTLFGWNIDKDFSLQSFAVAIGGALLLLALYRMAVSSRSTVGHRPYSR